MSKSTLFLFPVFLSFMFPTMSLLNIGAIPILRIDLVGQLTFLSFLLLFYKQRFRSSKIVELYGFVFATVVCPLISGLFMNSFVLLDHIEGLVQLIIFIIILFAVVTSDIADHSLKAYTEAFVILALVILLFAIYQFVSLNFKPLPFDRLYYNSPSFAGTIVESTFNGVTRASSIFKEPTHLGFFACNVLLYSIYSVKVARHKHAWIFLMFLSVIALIMSSSLMAFFSLFMLMMYKALQTFKIRYFMYIVIAFVIFIVIPDELRIKSVILSVFRLDFQFLSDGSLIYRIVKFLIGVSVFVENPIFGIGFNQLGHVNVGTLFDLSFSEYDTQIYFLNFHLLQVMVDSGIVGTFAWFILLYIVFNKVKAINCILIRERSISLIMLSLFSIDLPIYSPMRLLPLVLALSFVKYARN